MDRSRELYERIKSQGLAAIDEFIENRVSEELFLDFKRSSDDGKSVRLSQTDRNNLAKAISGFGNSEGGVIVWGVDCSADYDGADVAKAKVPIQNVHRFLGNLQGAVSGCTIPPHNRVEHHPVPCADDSGFVVTLVPKSDYAPHQMVGKLQYFIRAGSDFAPTPHQVLAGMFGKRPQPDVFYMFIVSPARNEGNKIIFEYAIIITNRGPGIAKDLYLSCMVYEGLGDNSKISWNLNDLNNWTGNSALGRQISIISNVGIRLPPQSHLQPLILRLELVPPFSESLSIKGSVGCSEAPSFKLEIENSKDEVNNIYDEYFEKLRNHELTDSIRHNLASNLLNIESGKNSTNTLNTD